MSISRNLVLFAVAIALFALMQVFMQQPQALLWDGAESAMAWVALGGGTNLLLPEYYFQWLWSATQRDLPAFRFPSAVLLCCGLVAFMLLSRVLFGIRTALLGGLVAISTLSLPFLGKIATLDSLLFALHVAGWLVLMQCAKQPRWEKALIFYLLLILSGIIHPWSTFIFFALGTAVLWTDRQRYTGLAFLKPWIGIAILPAITWITQSYAFHQPWLFLGSNFGVFLLFILAGFLPFTGFVVAGFRDYIGKISKGDEFSRILMGWLGAAILGGSPAAFGLMALLVARQMDAYFKKGYPYQNWVKSGAIIHLVFSFFGAMAILIFGVYTFGAQGFRAGAAMAGIYWSMSFLGIIGIFGGRKQLTLSAPMLAGSLSMLLFWLLVWPLLDTARKEKLSLLTGLDNKTEKVFITYTNDRNFPSLAVYGKLQFPEKDWAVVKNAFPTDLPDSFYVFTDKNTKHIPPICSDTIQYGKDFSLFFCHPGSRNQ